MALCSRAENPLFGTIYTTNLPLLYSQIIRPLQAIWDQ